MLEEEISILAPPTELIKDPRLTVKEKGCSIQGFLFLSLFQLSPFRGTYKHMLLVEGNSVIGAHTVYLGKIKWRDLCDESSAQCTGHLLETIQTFETPEKKISKIVKMKFESGNCLGD